MLLAMFYQLLSIIGTSIASPLFRRQSDLVVSNVDILNYALTLEHLESTLYQQAIAEYTASDFAAAGFADPLYANLIQISAEEATHVDFLTTAIKSAGAQAVAACNYDFPYDSPGSFLSLIATIESVGTSAYLGALRNITAMEYVEPAASIDTVEAMHTAYERSMLKLSPFPSAFVTPLGFNQAYTLASQFIVSCPSTNPTLPFSAYPYLTLSGTTQAESGMTTAFTTKATTNLPVYMAYTSGLTTEYVQADLSNGVATAIVPNNMLLDGQIYATLTTSMVANEGSVVVAGPAAVELALPNAISISTV